MTVRTDKMGRTRCGIGMTAYIRTRYDSNVAVQRVCVCDPDHDDLHRSSVLTRKVNGERQEFRAFWDDDGVLVKTMTEEEWQDSRIADAMRDLLEILQDDS